MGAKRLEGEYTVSFTVNHFAKYLLTYASQF